MIENIIENKKQKINLGGVVLLVVILGFCILLFLAGKEQLELKYDKGYDEGYSNGTQYGSDLAMATIINTIAQNGFINIQAGDRIFILGFIDNNTTESS